MKNNSPSYNLAKLGGFPFITLDEKDAKDRIYGVMIYPAADDFVVRGLNGELLTISVPGYGRGVKRLYELLNGEQHDSSSAFSEFAEKIGRENSGRVVSLDSLSTDLIRSLGIVERDLFRKQQIVIESFEDLEQIFIRGSAGGFAHI